MCQVIFKSHHDKTTGQKRTGFTEAYAQNLSADCDLVLWPRHMVPICKTSFCHDNHLCQVIIKSRHKVLDQTQTGFTEAYAQSLRAECDLDLWPSDMVLVHDTSSCHNEHLCQIIFKSHYAWQSYWQTWTGFTVAYAQNLSGNCDLDLWPSIMFLFATHPLVMMIIFAK